MTTILDPLLGHNRSLSRLLAEDLGRQILSGQLPPGCRVVPAEVVGGYQISRTTSREGLMLLVSKGLIVSRPGVGTLITEHDRWSLMDTDVLRWAPLDGWIADGARKLLDLLLSDAGAAYSNLYGDPMVQHLVFTLSRFVQVPAGEGVV